MENFERCSPFSNFHFLFSGFGTLLPFLISELLTYPQKAFNTVVFREGGANLKLSAFCVCNDRFMIWDSTKSERETGRFFYC